MTFILYKPCLVGDPVFGIERLGGVRARHMCPKLEQRRGKIDGPMIVLTLSAGEGAAKW